MSSGESKLEEEEVETKIAKTKSHEKALATALLSLALVAFLLIQVSAASTRIQINGNGVDTLETIQMFLILALAPPILIMTTCSTRIIIVLSFLRNVLDLQQVPPNRMLIGVALFLSLLIVSSVFTQVNEDAYQPYKEEQITQEQSVQRAAVPMKEFMLRQARRDDLDLFLNLSKAEVKSAEEVPLMVVIPAFMTSKLRRAFLIGFLIFIPFLTVDMMVSSTLMSMDMIMLPPVIISLSFRLLLFMLVDGWDLLFRTLVINFNMQRQRCTIRKDFYFAATSEIIGVFQVVILATMKLTLPTLASSVLIGFMVAVFQAATRIYGQTLSLVPKLLIIAVVLILLGPWTMEVISDFITYIFNLTASLNQGLFNQQVQKRSRKGSECQVLSPSIIT